MQLIYTSLRFISEFFTCKKASGEICVSFADGKVL